MYVAGVLSSLLALASASYVTRSFPAYNTTSSVAYPLHNKTSSVTTPSYPYSSIVTIKKSKPVTTSSKDCTESAPAHAKPKPCTDFYIGIWHKYKLHHKHPSAYVGFSSHDALQMPKSAAHVFNITHGKLLTGHNRVGSHKHSGSGVLQRKKYTDHKTTHHWKKLANAKLEYLDKEFTMGHGKAIFCATNDGTIFWQYTKPAGKKCKEIEFRAIDACPHPTASHGHPGYPTGHPGHHTETHGHPGHGGGKTTKTHPAHPGHSPTGYPVSHPTHHSHSHSKTSKHPTYPHHTYPTPTHTTHKTKPTQPITHSKPPTCSDDADPSGGYCTEEGTYPTETPAPGYKFIAPKYKAAHDAPRRKGLLVARK